jgi:hypothetical protein
LLAAGLGNERGVKKRMSDNIGNPEKSGRNEKHSRWWWWQRWVLGVVVLVSLGLVDAQAAPPRVSHVVIIWLKHPGNARDQQTLIRASEHFRRISGVLRVEAGTGMPVGRPGIEQPFDVGIVVTFKNRRALESFQSNPRHQLAVRQVLAPLARRFVVYNSLVQ